jgi:hypothetical protein
MSHLEAFIEMHTKLGMPRKEILHWDNDEIHIFLNLTNDVDRSIFYLGAREFAIMNSGIDDNDEIPYNVDDLINYINEMSQEKREEIKNTPIGWDVDNVVFIN